MFSRRAVLGSITTGLSGVLPGCMCGQTESPPTTDPRDDDHFEAADQSSKASVHVENRRDTAERLLTETGVGTTLVEQGSDDHWMFLETTDQFTALRNEDFSDQTSRFFDTIDFDEAFVFVYQVINSIPKSVTEVVSTGTHQDRFYFHLAWDDQVKRLEMPTRKTWFVAVTGNLPSKPVIKVTYTLGREW